MAGLENYIAKDSERGSPGVQIKGLTNVAVIRWVDSIGLDGWHPQSEVDRFCREGLEQMMVESVGYVIQESPDYVVIAQSIMDECKGNALKIPRVAIKDIRHVSIERVNVKG